MIKCSSLQSHGGASTSHHPAIILKGWQAPQLIQAQLFITRESSRKWHTQKLKCAEKQSDTHTHTLGVMRERGVNLQPLSVLLLVQMESCFRLWTICGSCSTNILLIGFFSFSFFSSRSACWDSDVSLCSHACVCVYVWSHFKEQEQNLQHDHTLTWTPCTGC